VGVQRRGVPARQDRELSGRSFILATCRASSRRLGMCLYLPESWATTRSGGRKACVPKELVRFQTLPRPGVAMLDENGPLLPIAGSLGYDRMGRSRISPGIAGRNSGTC